MFKLVYLFIALLVACCCSDQNVQSQKYEKDEEPYIIEPSKEEAKELESLFEKWSK